MTATIHPFYDLGSGSGPNHKKLKIMTVILELETDYGYEFTLVDDVIHYQCHAEHPDLPEIKPRLDYIKAHRPDAYRFIKHRLLPDTWPLVLWDASQAAAASARHHELLGHPNFAGQEWQRFARLFALAMQSSGALDPPSPGTNGSAPSPPPPARRMACRPPGLIRSSLFQKKFYSKVSQAVRLFSL
jgi:hypothetical protein